MANRFQPEVKMRISMVQGSVDKLIKSNQKSLLWMRGIQKLNIILLLGLIVGFYYIALEGTDTNLESFQIGVYILGATGLLIILLQILCIFLWHYQINFLSHEIQLILLNETQRYSNIIQWRLERGCSAIIFNYQSNVLLSASQIMEGSQKSYQINASEEQFTKKPNGQSRFMKEKQEKMNKQKSQYAKQYEEDKEKVKNWVMTTRGNEQEMLSIGNIHEEGNEDDQLNDHAKSNKEINIQKENKSKRSSKYINEINIDSGHVVIEMTPQNQTSHTKGMSNISHKSGKSNLKEDIRQTSKNPSQIKIKDEVLRFDSGEEDLSQDLVSEKNSQNQNILKLDQLSNFNQTGQTGIQKQSVPLILDLQNNNSQLQLGNYSSSRFQTDNNLFTTQVLKKEAMSNINLNDYTIENNSTIRPISQNDMNTPNGLTKQSNFKNFLHDGDDETPIEIDDDSDDKEVKQNEENHQKKKSKFNNFDHVNSSSPFGQQLSNSPQILKISPHDLDEIGDEEEEERQKSKQSESQSQIESVKNKEKYLLDNN